MTTRQTASTLTFTVELCGTRDWYPFLAHYADPFAARETAAKLAASQGIEARVADSDGKAWA